MESAVVVGYLPERLLRNLDVGGFVFYYHEGRKIAVVNYGVNSAGDARQAKADFVGNEALGVTLICYEEIHEMLAYPFFRGQSNISLAQAVIYEGVTGIMANS